MKRLVTASSAALLITAVFAAQPVLAIDPCWKGVHVGAWYSKYIANAGVRANEDFVSASPGAGLTIVHPMQVVTEAGDFIGWGTYRGLGTHVPNAISNCPDDTSSHWHVYIDGTKFGQYFCRVGFGDIAGTATDQLFTVRYGDCNGEQRWRAFLNGVRQTCQLINDDDAYASVVGGEVLGTLGQQQIDLRYHDLEYYFQTYENWYSWSAINTDSCANFGYAVNLQAADDAWTVAYP